MAEPLSPAAQAVLAALTQREYGLDPADIPNEAGRMACIASAALRAAADQVVPHEEVPTLMRSLELERLCQRQYTRNRLLAIAAELEEADRG